MASASPVKGPGSGRAPGDNISPRLPDPKHVAFELLFPESPRYRARLPMRVQIYPHDTTDSIVTTVKNFYGLYSGPNGPKGVSFEDVRGTTLIARYENFRNNMVVYVRVHEEAPAPESASSPQAGHPVAVGAQPYFAPDGYQLQAAQRLGQDISRPTSRTSGRRSLSPGSGRGRRSASTSTAGKKGRSRSSKPRGTSASGNADGYSDSINGYSSGDNAPGSASGRLKEQSANTEISVDNIVEGGRRKRAKFESSELPLFAPPQMPAATSNASVSPARHVDPRRPSLPFMTPGQNPFTNPRPLPSPHSYTNGHGPSGSYAVPAPGGHRSRGSIGHNGAGMGSMGGVLPTPDPTVGSCMSEEDKDVAMQLMRLGEMSNMSHGRTSASTLDDAFSGRADAASSTGATSDGESESEGEQPPARRQRLDEAGTSRKIIATESHFVPSPQNVDAFRGVDINDHMAKNSPGARPKPNGSVVKANKLVKPPKTIRPPTIPKHKKTASVISTGPMSPTSPEALRKTPIASTANMIPGAGEDEQPDLSTKPRCQRCRKSKKGCDRQRPCGRCRDAGLSIDQCISEDEGNGRKGRYGRHMGVPVKKEETPIPSPAILLPAALIAPAVGAIAIAPAMMDKNKKRKR